MKEDLARWDVKNAACLREIYAREFDFDHALVLCGDETCAAGASWLVKHHAQNEKLTAGQVQALLDTQRANGSWDTILHLVQALDTVDLKDRDVSHAAGVLRQTCHHDAPFLRAWSISAFARLAAGHPEYLEEAREIITAAMTLDHKPSVLARLKRSAKLLDQS